MRMEAVVMSLFLLGFVGMAQAQRDVTPPPIPRSLPQLKDKPSTDRGPVYYVEKLNESDLELMHRSLIVKGYKGLTPVSGTRKWSAEKNQPTYYSAICAKANGGMVRAIVTMTKHEISVEILK